MGNTTPEQKENIIENVFPMMICAEQCESNNICKHKSEAPKLTPLTTYICRYIAQINDYTKLQYPYPGNWEQQPQWVLNAFNIALKKRNSVIKAQTQKKTK